MQILSKGGFEIQADPRGLIIKHKAGAELKIAVPEITELSSLLDSVMSMETLKVKPPGIGSGVFRISFEDDGNPILT